MLSEEDKARIAAEEAYRASLRAGEQPVQPASFTDKMNKVRVGCGVVFVVIVALTMFFLTLSMGRHG